MQCGGSIPWLSASGLSTESGHLLRGYRVSMLARQFAVLSRTMQPPSWTRSDAMSVLLCALALGGLSGCVSVNSHKADTQIHLVIDLGSSGTSLCMFPVQVRPESAAAPRCSVGKLAPVCSKAKGGFAALTQGQTPEAVDSVVTKRLRSAWNALADKSRGGRADWRAQVQAAAALGTGGFRDPATGAQVQRPEWNTLWSVVDKFLRSEAKLSQVVARPLSGSEEGQLAWHGVRESLRPADAFAIMEVGGATVQLALADLATESAQVVAVSDVRGQDVTFDRFAKAGVRPDFAVCYSPSQRQLQNGRACIDLLFAEVFADARVSGLAAVTSPRQVFALGAPWLGLLRELPSAPPWSVKSDRELPAQVKLSDLQALADWICPMSDQELLAIAPHSYEAKRGAGRTCYSVAYHAAYFQAIAHAATAATVVPGGDDQWARGAATSGLFFPDCVPPSAK